VIPAPRPLATGVATSADGTQIAWYRYGSGERTILFVPTWNLVDARVVGYQVAALESRACVVTYDPRGAGASGRPEHGYDFPLHAADAVAVLDANDVERAALVTASRSINTAVLLATQSAHRVERIAAVAPYMQLEPEPLDSGWLDEIRNDWRGFVEPFMRDVFNEPGSEDVVDELVAIALEATPEIIAAQETELDWRIPASLLGRVSCPTLLIHGEADLFAPVALTESIAGRLPHARLEVISGAGHRPDIRSPAAVNPLLAAFLLPK
jgi:pimeloyl-ACP methyl ester carboxylesterase